MLPTNLYNSEQSRAIDQLAIVNEYASAFELMQRAGEFVYKQILSNYSKANNLLIFCGPGNNGGDGYIVAGLAKEKGMDVTVLAYAKPNTKTAEKAKIYAISKNCQIINIDSDDQVSSYIKQADLIIDALLGTGVDRNVTGRLESVINMINQAKLPTIACDVPSGLNSDNGTIMGVGVKAKITAVFIALKAGLYTCDGKQLSGKIKFSRLQLPLNSKLEIKPFAKLMQKSELAMLIRKRSENSHKGLSGHVGLLGGNREMAGAVIMAAKGAYRSGCGKVSVYTASEHAHFIPLSCAEIIAKAVPLKMSIISSINQVDVVAIGPGLGLDQWAKQLFSQALDFKGALVLDADALTILASEHQKRSNWILTPHPKEAAKLLNVPTHEIQADRYNAAKEITNQYGGVCLLKGSGTIIVENNNTPVVCRFGNAGQATAGMGDVLTGVIAGFIAQGYNCFHAALLACYCHAKAADFVAKKTGKIGMMASDLLKSIQITHNRLHHDK